MAKTFSQEEKQRWIDMIEIQKQSGLSIAQWCRENKIIAHCFYYWKDKLFPQTLTRSDFVELTDKNESGISVVFNHLRIHLEKGFDPLTLKTCLDVIRKYPC